MFQRALSICLTDESKSYVVRKQLTDSDSKVLRISCNLAYTFMDVFSFFFLPSLIFKISLEAGYGFQF